MVYCTVEEVESYTGFTYSNFKFSGESFDSSGWTDFLTDIIAVATQMINRYCNVTSLETHTVTEYQDGHGPTGDWGTYLDSDRTFYLREQPVISVTSVHEDVNSLAEVEDWTERTERSSSAAGDFALLTRYETSCIYFHSNVPGKRQANVKIVYVAGYAAGTVQLDEIGFLTIQVVSNILNDKKRVQEATTIRQTTVKNYAQMFSQLVGDEYLTPKIKASLNKYRRPTIVFTKF